MPIDPALLAKSIAALDPQRDLAAAPGDGTDLSALQTSAGLVATSSVLQRYADALKRPGLRR